MRNIREGVLFPFLTPSSASAVWLLVGVLTMATGLGDSYECGGFIRVSSASSGTLQSPGYPGNYPNYTRCIWILEAPAENVPQLTVDFVGEMYGSACSDYVEVRDGGQSGELLLSNCATLTSHVVTSTGRWMYVFFASDGFSQVDGLSATYSAQFVGSAINDSIASPITSCRSYEFECSNRLCLSRSYRCDGFYDCGCGADCDEDGCDGLPIAKDARMGIGFAVGVSVFVLAAALGLLLEKRHNWEKEKGASKSAEPLPLKRHGWASFGKDNKIATGSNNNAAPPSPKVSSPCAINVSEIA
ncbi:uncharacterized protein LOC143283314 [Babylonia areolata]|uniref:uncharacterized protein LOC143283314 n=1 Tax=Babylonia areolata TaxID=304850 RepID=UPI003FD09B71